MQFPFNQSEQIFELTGPSKDTLRAKGLKLKDIELKSKACKVCTKEVTDLKKIVQCEFCALFGCMTCIYK
jgi:hypothetical protein